MTNDFPITPTPSPTPPEALTPPPPVEAAAPPAEETSPPADVRADVVAEATPPSPHPEPPAEGPAPEPVAEGPAVEAPEEEAAAEEPEPSNKHWYVVKVQSGREESIKEAVERRVKIEALEEFFGQIVIPMEKVVEMRNGKRVVKERKLYPGYLMVEVEFNDRILYLFRETSGVGDFVGAGLNRAPVPMSPREVEQMLRKSGDKSQEKEIKPSKAPVDRGDRVKIKDGTFAGMEGEVKDVIESKSQVRVELMIFGRPVSVEFEYWQVEPV